MRKVENYGVFWLLDTPDHKVNGEFELFDECLGILTIFDPIEKEYSHGHYYNWVKQLDNYSLILGQVGSVFYALKNVRFVSMRESGDRRGIFIFEADITINLGSLIFDREEELSFDNISFSFEKLYTYLNDRPISTDIINDLRECKFQFKETKSDIFDLDDSLKFCFICWLDFSLKTQDYDLTAVATTTIKVETKTNAGKTIDEWLELIEQTFSMYFAFLIGHYMCPIKITTSVMFRSTPHVFKIYYRHFNKKNKVNYTLRNCLSGLMPHLPKYISQFHEFKKVCPQAAINYFTLYKYEAILGFRYLTVMYSIETLSRDALKDHFYIDYDCFKEEYQKPLIRFINDELQFNNKGLKQKIIDGVRFANERSLKTTLQDMIKVNLDLLLEVANFCPNNDSKNLKDMRNWLTHYTKESMNLAESHNLLELYFKARTIFEVTLFKKINMSDNDIIRIIRRKYLQFFERINEKK